MSERIIVTGGRGFVGSFFVQEALQRGYDVVDIDKMTYAASPSLPWDNHPNYTWIKQDINDIEYLPICRFICHFCAESHVCNSLVASEIFMHSNVMGTHHLLELLRGKKHATPTLIAISTDEVYGSKSNSCEEPFIENSPLNPSNPYAGSKAASEQLVISYHNTYEIPYVITRSSNNYGSRQYEEKLVPRCLYELQNENKIPLHGDATYKRDWLYVKDNVNGIFSIIDNIDTCINQTFNIGANNHLDNLEVAKTIVEWIHGEDEPLENHIEFIPNRLGQDNFYHICTDKLKRFTGWEAQYTDGLHKFI